MTAYYNEHDPYAAQWLRNLIAAGHIADGEVDDRSILDVAPDDLRGFTQCHFFAGIGVWSYALRLAGWRDDRAVWTGSCPCQPFSVAGRALGHSDERHLWPHWFWLIEQRRPPRIFGEQVEAAIRHGWLDLVQADLEGIGYAVGHAGIPAAGVGAPHIRQRLWFVADCDDDRCETRGEIRSVRAEHDAQHGRAACGMAYGNSTRLEGRHAGEVGRERAAVERGGGACGVADDDGIASRQGRAFVRGRDQGSNAQSRPRLGGGRISGTAGPNHGHWRDADWLLCRDGKWRPVEPGTFPLAHGAPARVGRLRAYGNAIVAQAAAEFIAAYMECRP